MVLHGVVRENWKTASLVNLTRGEDFLQNDDHILLVTKLEEVRWVGGWEARGFDVESSAK